MTMPHANSSSERLQEPPIRWSPKAFTPKPRPVHELSPLENNIQISADAILLFILFLICSYCIWKFVWPCHTLPNLMSFLPPTRTTAFSMSRFSWIRLIFSSGDSKGARPGAFNSLSVDEIRRIQGTRCTYYSNAR